MSGIMRMIESRMQIVFVLAVLTWVGCDQQAAAPSTIRKGPYLIYQGVTTEMDVLWQMHTTQTCTVEWGVDEQYAGGSVQTTEYGSDHQHAWTLSNLIPGTKYYYRVTDGGGDVHTGSFLAAPPEDALNVKFLAYGDTRSFPADHDAVNAEMITTTIDDPAYQTFALLAGDWVNGGDLESDWDTQLFEASHLNTRELQANLPIQGCRGNHEQTGALYLKYWPYAYESDFYWSFDYGPLHVAVVDQYVDYSIGSAQYTWLETDLAATTKPWKCIMLHEPGWSAGGSHPNNPDVQNVIHPLCLTYNVKIVFAGHNHYYARCDVDGVQHITAGGGGAPLRTPDRSYPHVVTAESVHHFCEIDIQGDKLDCTVRRVDGTVLETWQLTSTPSDPAPVLGFRL